MDLDTIKTRYTTFPDCRCEVHRGFYLAEQKVIDEIIAEVTRLKKLADFASYSIKTTGHSLGAALAQLTAMGEFSIASAAS